MNGKIVEEIKLTKEIKKITWFSEHVTTFADVPRHWFVYTTPDTTTFIDLNDLSSKYSIPKIDRIKWVPKKSEFS